MKSTEEYQVIYLTGPPATGKSTLVKALQEAVQPLESFSYSKVLAGYIEKRTLDPLSENQIRQQSSRVVTAEDVASVDAMLIDFVNTHRHRSHVIIDSHAVTKEDYGFRVTPFRLDMLKAISPSQLFVLYCDAKTVIGRIKANSQGRPLVTVTEATMHNDLQGSVAITYAILLGIPVYFLDSNRPVTDLAQQIIGRISAR